MKSKRFIIIILLLIAVVIMVLIACRHKHTWAEATCITPKTCECGKVDGEALGHTWVDADCETAKTCSVCKEIQGEPLGHTWKDADCETAKTCTVCNLTDGKPLEHNWMDATYTAPKTCSICNQTEGEPLPKPVIFKDANGKVRYTQEVFDTAIDELNKAGLDIAWTNHILDSYFTVVEGKDNSELDMEVLGNLIDSLDKQLEAQEQAQQAQREENIKNQQSQESNQDNTQNNQENTNNNSSDAPSNWVTPEKEDSGNQSGNTGSVEPWVEAGISKEQYEAIVKQLEENAANAGDGGELVGDTTLNGY